MVCRTRNRALIGLGAALIGGACLWAYGLLESSRIELSRIAGQGLLTGSDLRGLTAVHLSDLHTRELGKFEQDVIEIVQSIDPDFIFLTGDYVPWEGNYEAALGFLSKLKANIGVWAVMGDYDYSTSRKSCTFCHAPDDRRRPNLANVKFLRNACEEVRTPSGKVNVCGVDENFPGTVPGFENALNSAVDGPSILLSHSPLYFDKLKAGKDILVLAGDTHGGQLPLPAWLYRVLGYDKNAIYNQGLFREGSKSMYVSRGLGTSHVPIRISRKPEIAVFRF